MAGTVHQIYVYQDSDAELRVYPPLVVVDAAGGAGNRDDIEFVNLTDEDIAFVMPPGALGANAEAGTAPKKGKGPHKKVHSTGATRAVSYQVFSVPGGKKAKGNSDPMLIIEN